MKKYLFLLPLIFLFPSLLSAESFVWQKFPIAPKLQYDLGVEGGEGHQVAYDLKVAPSDTSIIYLLSDCNGVWKSTDSGGSWNPCWNGLSFVGGQSLSVNPTDPNIVLVAGSDMLNATNPQVDALSGIAKTVNGGTTWTIATSTFYVSGQDVTKFWYKSHLKGSSLIVWPTSGSTTVFAGTFKRGLLMSSDNGSTWAVNESNATIGTIYDMAVHPTTPGTIYLCTSTGLRKKVGSAASTVISSTGMPSNPTLVLIDHTTPNTMYFGVGGYGVYKSTVAGTSCSAVNTGMTSLVGADDVSCLKQDRNNQDVLYCTWHSNAVRYGFYRTTNAGSSWAQSSNYDTTGISLAIIGYGPFPLNYGACVVPGGSGTAYLGLVGGIIVKSTNAASTWAYSNSGYLGGGIGHQFSKTGFGFSRSTSQGTDTYFLGMGDWGTHLGTSAGYFTPKTEPSTYIATKRVAIEPDTSAARVVASFGTQAASSRLYYSDNYGNSWTACSSSINTPGWSASTYDHKNIFWPKIPGSSTPTTTIFAGNARSFNRGATFNWLINSSTGMLNDVYYKNPEFGVTSGGSTLYLYYDLVSNKSSATYYTINIPGSYNLVDSTFSANSQYIIYALDRPSTLAAAALGGVWKITINADGTLNNATKTYIADAVDLAGYCDLQTICSDRDVTEGNDDILYAIGNFRWLRYRGTGLWRSVDSNGTWTNITDGSNIDGIDAYTLMVNPDNRWIYLLGQNGSWKLPPPGLATEDITDSANQVQAKLTLDTMTVDGLGNEDAWADANSITLSKTIDGSTVLTGSVTAKVLYDSTGFYTLININDPNLHKDSSDSASHNDSSAEIYIDGDNNNSIPVLEAGTDRQFRVGWNRNINQIAFSPAGGTTTGVLYGSSTTATGYKEEWYVPFANFGYSGTSTLPQSPSLSLPFIGFDVFYNEDNNGGSRDAQTGWSGTITNYLDTSEYGDLVFGTQTAGGSDVPTVITGTVTPIATSTATLKGTITANNHDTDAWFRYGTVSGSLSLVTSTSQFTGSTPDTLSKAITGLTESTLYYYQAVGSSSEGLAYGSELSFTTAATSQITPLSGCVSHWKFDENTGTTVNDSVGTRTGTATGMTWTASGKLGSAGSFDGIDDYVVVSGLYGSPSVYSISGWCYTIGSDTAGATLISLGDYTGILVRATTALKTLGFRFDGVDWKNTGTSTPAPFNEWHHYTFSVDDANNSQTFYIDGTYATTSTFTANTNWSGQGANTYMGKHGNGATNVDLSGYLDDVRIFNRALSAQEAIDLASIPVITGNGTATNITTSSCTFLGTASTNGSISANLYVQYGLSSGNYTGTSSPQINLTGSTTSSGASWAVSGLSQNTQYFYRLQVISDAYTINGTEQNFTTSAIATAPVSVTYPATSIGSTSATLNGSSTPNGLSTTAWFQYGTSSDYTGTSSTTDAGSGVNPVNISKVITGLSEGTLYVYRLQSENGSGTANGDELSFTTTDVTAPSGTFTINGSAIGINTGSATVYIEATDNVGIVAYSIQGTSTEPGVGSWTTIATTTSYIASVPYDLTAGEGTKTIWGWVKDGWGNTSTASSDTIILDQTDPTIMITSPTSLSTYDARATSVSLGGTATDSGSLLASVDWTNSQTGGTGAATISLPSITDGLVFYADMDSIVNGQIVDESSYGIVGTITGAVGTSSGKIDGGLYFDGIDDSVSFADPADGHLDHGTRSFGFGLWYKPQTLSAGKYIFTKGTANAYQLYIASLGTCYSRTIFGTQTAQLDLIGFLGTSTYSHLFVTVDRSNHPGSSTLKTYFNGNLVTTNNNISAGSIDNAVDLKISGEISLRVNGTIDDFRIYNRALSESEITQIYNEGNGQRNWSASSIPLTIGVNTITVVATDNAGNVGSDVISVTGGYSVEQVTGFSRPLSFSIVFSTQFQQGLKNYGIIFSKHWRSTADILRLIADPDNEITTAINNP